MSIKNDMLKIYEFKTTDVTDVLSFIEEHEGYTFYLTCELVDSFIYDGKCQIKLFRFQQDEVELRVKAFDYELYFLQVDSKVCSERVYRLERIETQSSDGCSHLLTEYKRMNKKCYLLGLSED